MSTRNCFCATLSLSMVLGLCNAATAQSVPTDTELNNQIRRDKFDLVLPEVMREHNVDM